MGAFSNYLEAKIVDHFLRNAAVPPPATVYVALFESDPGEADGGTEAAYTGYARQASTWTALDANGQTKNVSALTFPANGNAAGASIVTHLALYDAATGGNRLFYATLATSKTLDPSDVLSFATGAIAFGID